MTGLVTKQASVRQPEGPPGAREARPTSFKARARAHQARHRKEVLRVPSYPIYAHRLVAQGAVRGLNFYGAWPGLLELVHRRYRRADTALYNNLLRSEHIPFNFFGPLALTVDGELTHALIKWIAPTCSESR